MLRAADPQLAMTALLGAHCGLRVGETVSLRRTDVHNVWWGDPQAPCSPCL